MRWEHPPDVFLVRIGDDDQHHLLDASARSKTAAHAWGLGDPVSDSLFAWRCPFVSTDQSIATDPIVGTRTKYELHDG